MPRRHPRFWLESGGIAAALAPVACLYQAGYRLRRATATPITLRPKLLCIGNLVAGGAGKTPVALAVGTYIKAQGVNACYLSKGYGGRITSPTLVEPERHSAADVGDEPLLLARLLPTLVSRDRVAGAREAERRGYDLILLDDGFQNPTLKPDMALVVVDAEYGFGNGRTLPAGPLREPAAYGLSRADAVVLLHRGGAAAQPFDGHGLPILAADLHTACPPEAAGRKLAAFSGIARPEQFFTALERQCGASLAARHAFPDHHPFSEAELSRLREEATQLGARLITTAKDAVRLPESLRGDILVAEAALNWHNAAQLHAVLAPLIPIKED